MATLAFDTLQYARRLKSAGVPEQQAEVQAELMAEAFGFYADNLVTRDYLDARLDALESRISQRFAEQDARWEQRFSEQDARIDERFAEQDVRWEQRFAEQDVRFEQRFAEQDVRFEQRFSSHEVRVAALEATMKGGFRLHSVLLGLVLTAVVIPLARDLLPL